MANIHKGRFHGVVLGVGSVVDVIRRKSVKRADKPDSVRSARPKTRTA
jgi:hypothetical protein